MTTRSYFLAIKPPPAVADEIGRLRAPVGAGFRPMEPERLHITLAYLGEFFSPTDPTERIAEAMQGFTALQCRIVLDLLIGGSRSVFLMPSERLRGLVHVQSCIALRLRQSGLFPRRFQRFSPHVTLLYRHAFSGMSPIDPISWTAEEIILVESGDGRHAHRLCWPLIADTARATRQARAA